MNVLFLQRSWLSVQFQKHLEFILCFISVAEQAESIDNPLHEAAKRGKCDFSFSCIMLKNDFFFLPK